MKKALMMMVVGLMVMAPWVTRVSYGWTTDDPYPLSIPCSFEMDVTNQIDFGNTNNLLIGSSPDGQLYASNGIFLSTVFFDGTPGTSESISQDNLGVADFIYDSVGNLFLVDSEGGRILKRGPLEDNFSTYASGFFRPRKLTIDGQENLIVSDGQPNIGEGGSLWKVTPSGTVSLLTNNVAGIVDLKTDNAGNIYAVTLTGDIYTVSDDGSTSLYFSIAPHMNGLPFYVEAFAIDNANNIFVSLTEGQRFGINSSEIYRINPSLDFDLFTIGFGGLPSDMLFTANNELILTKFIPIGYPRGGNSNIVMISGNFSASFFEIPTIEPDPDNDGIPSCSDNCPHTPNYDQYDADSDGVGDACDVCPLVAYDHTDSDADGVGDACDGCPTDPLKTEPGISGCGMPDYTITALAYGHGTISPAGPTMMAPGSSQTYTITPDQNNKISNVRVGNVDMGPLTSYTFDNVSADQTIKAIFIQIRHNVTSSSGPGGSITPSGSYNFIQGTSPMYTINPAAGYRVADVLVDGASVGAVSSFTFENIAEPHAIEASFAANPTYTITASVTGSGSITPAGVTSIQGGLDQQYAITPAPGSRIDTVRVNGLNKGAITNYTFHNVAANQTIEVNFVPDSYTITASVYGHGAISPAGVTTVATGGSQTYTFTPEPNYKVSNVKVGNINKGPLDSYTFDNVTANQTIRVSFTQIRHTVTSTAGAGGSITPSGNSNFIQGSSPIYNITPATGYQVADVLVDGASVGAVSSFTFENIAEPHTIEATFASIE